MGGGQQADAARVAEIVQNEFLSPEFSRNMLELAVVRKALLSAVQAAIPELFGTVLDVGCGYKPYESLFLAPTTKVSRYLGMDVPTNIYLGRDTDIVWNGIDIPMESTSVDCVIATEFFEHSSSPDRVLEEVFRVLRPGGKLFLTVPFLWPLHETPFDYARYTPFAIKQKLERAGFYDIRVQATGGANAALAIMLGIWLWQPGRSLFHLRAAKAILRRVAVPLMRYLYLTDEKPMEFGNGNMIIGVSALASKPALCTP